MLTSKMLIDEPLMKRRRMRSPGLNSAVQLSPGPVPVDEIRIGRAADVEDVRRTHAHLAPFEAIRDRRAEAFAAGVGQKCAGRSLGKIVVVALLLEVAHDAVG